MNKINIIITHKCNLMCKHCYMNAGNMDFEETNIIFSKFKCVIQKIKEMGVKEIMLNGFTFDKKIINYVDDYCLSLDGLEDNHNYLRGTPKGFKKTIDTIKYLQQKGKNVTIQVTVTERNLSEILDIIDLLNSLKIKNINLCCLLDEGRSIRNNLDSNIDLEMFNSIITKAYRNTGYNIKIHSNVFNKIDTVSL